MGFHQQWVHCTIVSKLLGSSWRWCFDRFRRIDSRIWSFKSDVIVCSDAYICVMFVAAKPLVNFSHVFIWTLYVSPIFRHHILHEGRCSTRSKCSTWSSRIPSLKFCIESIDQSKHEMKMRRYMLSKLNTQNVKIIPEYTKLHNLYCLRVRPILHQWQSKVCPGRYNTFSSLVQSCPSHCTPVFPTIPSLSEHSTTTWMVVARNGVPSYHRSTTTTTLHHPKDGHPRLEWIEFRLRWVAAPAACAVWPRLPSPHPSRFSIVLKYSIDVWSTCAFSLVKVLRQWYSSIGFSVPALLSLKLTLVYCSSSWTLGPTDSAVPISLHKGLVHPTFWPPIVSILHHQYQNPSRSVSFQPPPNQRPYDHVVSIPRTLSGPPPMFHPKSVS